MKTFIPEWYNMIEEFTKYEVIIDFGYMELGEFVNSIAL